MRSLALWPMTPLSQIVDIPVPQGLGGLAGRGGLPTSSQEQNSPAFSGVEYVDISVACRGGLQGSRPGQGSTASSSH